MTHYLTDVELSRRFAVSRVTIWRWVAQKRFPAPVTLGPKCSRWRISDVETWEADRIAELRTEVA